MPDDVPCELKKDNRTPACARRGFDHFMWLESDKIAAVADEMKKEKKFANTTRRALLRSAGSRLYGQLSAIEKKAFAVHAAEKAVRTRAEDGKFAIGVDPPAPIPDDPPEPPAAIPDVPP